LRALYIVTLNPFFKVLVIQYAATSILSIGVVPPRITIVLSAWVEMQPMRFLY